MAFELVGNPNVIEMEYAVRGPIPQRAAELRKQGRKIVPCNIGNPQALGQKPLTFYRQVLSLVEDPARIGRERALNRMLEEGAGSRSGPLERFPEYVLEVGERVLAGLESGLGAYTESKGPAFIREAVARFIDQRDGVASSGGPPCDPERVFLTNGASEGAKRIIELLIAGPKDGIMIPIPQYPLYSASIRQCGGVAVGYYPDEDRGWTLERPILDEAYQRAGAQGVRVKGIVVINPGNPTGAVLPEQSVRDVLDFAAARELVVIADEVYQENTYGAEFVSFARVLGRGDLPLFSLHSVSKGFYGECGHRGGYLEVRNPPRLKGVGLGACDVLLKQASVSLCSNTVGQVLTYLLVSPPPAGSEPSALFALEKQRVLDTLLEKATMVKAAFREMQGVECFGRIGALYLFPRLGQLPPGTTDFDYCMSLLEATGLSTVNGSGFGQREGTQHLRIAFLPEKALLEEVLPQWVRFHNQYVARK